MTSRREPMSAPQRRPAKPPRRPPIPPAEEIYERIVSAIFEHRLAPGTKLVEDRLVEIFGANRNRIRSVLARLAHEQVVHLEPNRGAFVAAPTPSEAREIFESRRLIEPGVVRRLIETVDRAGIERLRALVREEAKARADNDRRSIIRISGEFHIVLAQLAGNRFLTRTMRELASLTCLIIFLYDSPSIPSCHGEEHAEITEAIASKDTERAVQLMLHHLDHVESSLTLQDERPVGFDLEHAFA